MSIVHRFDTLVDAMTARYGHLPMGLEMACVRLIEEQQAELERQQQMWEQWRRDALRYRFLMEHDADDLCREPLWPVVDWMRGGPVPTTKAEIDAAMQGNLCRCGTYLRIREAIHKAADTI